MTLEQQVDFKALSLISKNKTYCNSDLIALFANILTPSKAAELHKKFSVPAGFSQQTPTIVKP